VFFTGPRYCNPASQNGGKKGKDITFSGNECDIISKIVKPVYSSPTNTTLNRADKQSISFLKASSKPYIIFKKYRSGLQIAVSSGRWR
jgi:hypothetical protein